MKELAQLTAEEGVELALSVCLDKGFDSEYYGNWQEYVGEDYFDDVEGYNLTSIRTAWEALLEYVPRNKDFEAEGLSARVVATQDDGPAHYSDTYYVVFSLSDGKSVRFFQRNGYYQSYDGGHLEEGIDQEVFPRIVTVLDWH
jgi:hypothetical protein